MKKNLLLSLFSFALVADLVGIVMENTVVQYFSKPLIVLSLLAWFLLQPLNNNKSRFLVIFALLFSWIGDILLMFDKQPGFFLAGLGSFLVAHLFYITFFAGIKKKERVINRPLLILVVAGYYAILIGFLYSHLFDMKLPVILYGVIISTMFALSLHLGSISNRVAGQLMLTGAAFFVASDSLLAFHKFYAPIPLAGIFIMVTYAIAQFAIVQGAARYLGAYEN